MKEITAQEIVTALKSIGKSRKWLASVLGVQPSTIDNWLSRNRPIPEMKQAQILQILARKDDAPAAAPAYNDVVALPLRFSSEEWALLQNALPPGVDVEAWARRYVLEVLPHEAASRQLPGE